jgi:hypothetical protein
MNKKLIVSGVAAFAILAAIAGITSTVMAADSTSTDSILGKLGFHQRGKMTQLTDAQKEEMKTKMDAVNAALEAGDYNAWVTAEKAMNENSPMLSKVTSENFSDYVKQYKQREADMATRKAKADAVNAALEAGDYNAWVTAEKAVNENSPILSKITADNFSKYSEAYKLRKQADSILTELGVNDHGDKGFGPGGMRGEGGPGRGMHGGFGSGDGMNGASATNGAN